MKRISLALFALAAGSSFTFAEEGKKESAPAPAPAKAEKEAKADPEALEKFKAQAEEIDKYMKENKEAMKSNPAVGMKALKELVGKITAIDAKKLPADLKVPLEGVSESFKLMLETLSFLPLDKLADPEAMQKWVQEEVAKNPDFLTKMQKMGEDVQEITAKGQEWGKKLDKAAKKYGVEIGLGGDEDEEKEKEEGAGEEEEKKDAKGGKEKKPEAKPAPAAEDK